MGEQSIHSLTVTKNKGDHAQIIDELCVTRYPGEDDHRAVSTEATYQSIIVPP